MKQVTQTEVFAAVPYLGRWLPACRRAIGPRGGVCDDARAPLVGPLLKILVDGLGQANSRLQQLLLHDRQRMLNVDAGQVVAVAQAVVGGRGRVPLCEFSVAPSPAQQASQPSSQNLVFNHEEQAASAVLMKGTIRP